MKEKISNGRISVVWLYACVLFLACGASAEEKAEVVKASRVVLFYGDSLTAGYGIDSAQAFPALIQARLDSLGWNYEAVNAGLSGETSAGGLRRVNWILRRSVDVFVLELGANDGLRGIAPHITAGNLQGIIDKVKEKYPQVAIVVVGMEMPPNMGPDYTAAFRDLFPKLAKDNAAALVPFLLEGVALVPELNLPDGNHPTPAGHQILADNVWQVLKPLLAARVELAVEGAEGD
jgi:acyl-CoA thioesterase I